jgi:ABC-type transport system involved in cytochrome c biogenesis permease subunit
MSVSLLQPYFLMSKTRSYAQIIIGSRLFLTAMAIHLSLRVAPLDLQQGGNSRIPYVHVPAARMSILVYIATAINTFFFLLTKHPLFLRSSGTGTEMGAFFTLFTLVTGGFRGRPMWGTFWVWDARLTSVFISFLIYLGALRFQKLPVEPASISIRAGPIDIPIIQSTGGIHRINLGALADLVHQYMFLCSFQSCLTLLTSPSQPVSSLFWKHVFLFHLFSNLP